MSTLTVEQMTADEFFVWANRPENRDRHFELERGKVVEMPQPGERHGVVCMNAGWVLSGYVRQRGRGYVCSNDTGLILERDPDTVRGPDLSLYDDLRRFDELNLRYSDRPPKLAVEVLSPTDRWGKVTRRITHFLNRGIAMVWLVDPEDRSVTVYRPGELPQVFDEKEELTGYDILPGLRCRVAEFFFLPGETTPSG